MEIKNKKIDVDNLISNNDMVILYFSGSDWGVCKIIKPQIIALLKKYPKIKSAEIKTEESIEISAQYNIFTLPSVLMFIDGKEVIRKLRYMSLVELESNISRYYNLYDK